MDESLRIPAEEVAAMLEATPAEASDDRPCMYVVRIDGRRFDRIAGMDEGFEGGFIECETLALARRIARCVNARAHHRATRGNPTYSARIEVKP